ncbi:Kelch repeat-containing protein [Draconibacterium mangrovi]|uniref:Kelch repeat-containing protein n=1 Tax=Draconibacterium mangrovi TaxID=2697469 RepID=UPI0013D51193|nr:kelch repeat-containing protein [Draconibacterium mangrovi]
MKINWGSLPDVPPATNQQKQKGLAGALAGVSSESLLVAGGSNFPDAPPWNEGTKTYYDDIFFFNLKENKGPWEVAKTKLPAPMAYSACVSLNDEVICIGGENHDGLLSKVLKLKLNKTDVEVSALTDLPVAMSNGGAATIGSMVYVAGGAGAEGNLASFYCADFSKDKVEWKELPALPGPVSNAVVAAQWDGTENCIYVLGGRNRTGELTTFFSSVWKYSPSKNEWQTDGQISSDGETPLTLAAGTGAAVGKNYIVLLGGDKGALFNKTEEFINATATAETPEQKQEIINQKIKHLESHPGFSKQVFLYNTVTGECFEKEKLPFPAQVTTLAVKFGNKIYVPNGEIRPGVRTPGVNYAEISVVNPN